MEAFGIMGFVFWLSALAKVIMLEKQLKESGVLKEKAESGKSYNETPLAQIAPPSSGVFCLPAFVFIFHRQN